MFYSLLLGLLLSFSSAYAQDAENFPTFTEHTIRKGQSLFKIAQAYDLGMDEILRANPNIIDPTKITAGKKIILPTTHLFPDARKDGIVINLSEPRLYFYFEGEGVSFPISVGKDDRTPTGRTKISEKIENPTWTPPASIHAENPKLPDVVPAGPNNPLGKFAFRLNALKNRKWQRIMIHGTNEPWSVGAPVSHGCIRLYPQDIETLFGKAEINTPVAIVNQPIKIQEINDEVYMEVSFQEMPEVASENLGVRKMICKKVKNCENRINWDKAHDTVAQNRGVVVKISNEEEAEG